MKSQYRYISVDEAQDTSKIQHAIIKKIAEGNNLFMVGDEDQSIYGFRGAYPKALLNFRYDYTNPYIMRMERNYRSTPQIVDKAQLFISKNKGRYEKNMSAERDSGDEVKLIYVKNREEQYLSLIDIAKANSKETAFLFRDNESSVVLVDSLLRENIPFRLKSPEMNFFGTRVILDIIAYLKLTLNDHDFESLKRVCNRGIFYLKRQQLEYAINDCKYRKLSVYDALEKQMHYVKREYRDRAEDFKSFIHSISSLSPYNAIRCILDNGYGHYMEENGYDYGKVELLKILAKKETTIESFLDRLQFLEKQIQGGFDTKSLTPVILSTIHSSKGLEYDTVFMVDVYDGRFPSSRPNVFSKSKDNADGEQEERRLFYVGITRAKNSLNLFSISDRPSSYVEELFPEVQDKRDEEKRLKAEADRKKLDDYLRQQQIEQEKERARKQAEFEARQKELEERRRKEAEEHARRKALEDQRCREEILLIIDQQNYQARDSLGRRWVRCEKCGEVKQDKDFSSYGGPNHINLGICSVCSRKTK
ncbi:MAG: ATP-dependent helicase [Clostridia bacterium]|nr:ATP-dependent helicase [Clostridia bacterium]